MADRFVHFHYFEWPSEVKAYISLQESGRRLGGKEYNYKDFGILLELRGITKNGLFLIKKK